MWSMATLHLKRSPGKATATWAHFQENPSDPEVHREGYEALRLFQSLVWGSKQGA